MTKTLSLGQAQRGFIGRIRAIDATVGSSVLTPVELESRLIEMGFVEDARVEPVHVHVVERARPPGDHEAEQSRDGDAGEPDQGDLDGLDILALPPRPRLE